MGVIETQAKKSQNGEQEAAGMHAIASAKEQPTYSTVGSRHVCNSDTWLHVSFRVKGKGCCELGAAVVLKCVSDKVEARENILEQGLSVPCKLGMHSEQQQQCQAACIVSDAGLNCKEEVHSHKEQAVKPASCSSDDERLLGFVTTAFKPEMHGMSGGRACIRFKANELSPEILNSIHIINPYAPGTLRKVQVTEWCSML